MKIPLSLLKKFLPIDQKPLVEIADALVSLGIEVDEITAKEPTFSGVVAGKIQEIATHPRSKQLLVLQVRTDNQTCSVVCGDLTLKKSAIVAFAPVGASVQGKIVQKKSLQGESSDGMLVSAKELGIYEEAGCVLRLDESFALGQDLRAALYDPIFVCSLTPNLGHCQSVLGIARELSAHFQIPLEPVLPKGSYRLQETAIENLQDCSRYSSLIIEKIPPTPTPFWLRSSLAKSGFASSFLLVDLLNYVMLLTGQPMHAFALDAVKNTSVSVRRIKKDTSLTFLDDVTRICPAGALGIYAEQELIALAGIMGGKNSSVEQSSSSYFLEAAHFHPTLIRKTAAAMNLRSESSMRFEKGVDPALGPDALAMVAALVKTITGVQTTSTMQSSSHPPDNRQIVCRKTRVEKVLGAPISLNEMENIFSRLDCASILHEDNALEVLVPTYRNDLLEEIDLVEEIARIYGLQHLDQDVSRKSPPTIQHDAFYLFSTKLRERCLRLGLNECITPDLISHHLAKLTEETSLLKKDLLQTLYAKSDEHTILRSTLLGSLLQVLSQHVRMKHTNMQSFEMGKVHRKDGDIPVEKSVLSCMTSGKIAPSFWGKTAEDHDFFSVKGLLEELLAPWDLISFSPSSHPSLHPTRQADIYLSGEDIGVIGEVHPEILASFSIKQKAFFAEIHLDPLWKTQKNDAKIECFSPYPSSTRDWTIPLPSDYLFISLHQLLQTLSSAILEKTELLDVFHNKETGKNHYTIRFTYRSQTDTLSLHEVEKEQERLQKQCEERLQKDLGSL